MKNYESLSHTRYDCKYHVVFIPKYRRKKIYGAIRRHLGEIFHELAKQKESRILEGVLSKNTNELKTGAPGRFDRHRPVASPRSGACRRRCRRFGFPVRAGKTPSSNGMPRSRAETWI